MGPQKLIWQIDAVGDKAHGITNVLWSDCGSLDGPILGGPRFPAAGAGNAETIVLSGLLDA